MQTEIEIEHKYLLKDEFNEDVLKHLGIEYTKKSTVQAYLNVSIDSEIRIKRDGFKCYLTIKDGVGKKRVENSKEISRAEFETYLSDAIGDIIEKNRYYIQVEGLKEFCIDIYKGFLEPLKVLEVEFFSDQDSINYILPEWILEYIVKDVTYDERFKNKNLSIIGYDKEWYN